MPLFGEAKKNLSEKMSIFEDVRKAYIENSSKRPDFLAARDNFVDALNTYENTLPELSKEDYDKEYREALQFDEIARREYDPFIAKEPLQPGQQIAAKPFNRMEAASVKCQMAQKWLAIMLENHP